MKYIFALIFTLFALTAQAQLIPYNPSDSLIQMSGLVLTDMNGSLVPVPFATVYLPNQKRGTYTNYKGFFSIVVHKGEKVRFTSVGFDPTTTTIPDTLTQDRYSVVQLISQDTINLPEIVIMPWPSKDHFKIEFLKMDVTPELQRRAIENLANNYIAEARKDGTRVPYAAKESANFYLRQQSKEYVYMGQTPPMNIFNPIAWGKFFTAWKNGDYKRK
jgi:CarboxypepD_reg-like domain